MRKTTFLLAGSAFALVAAEPAAAQVTPDDGARIAHQEMVIAGYSRVFEEDFARADAARLRGDCMNFRHLVGEMRRGLGTEVGQQLPPDMRGQFTVRLGELEGRPCTSPPPAQGLTQGEIDAVAQQQRALQDSERELREEQARNRATVHIAGGYGESEIPRTNYGFVRDGPSGTPERPAAFSERRIPMLYIEAGAEFRGIGRFTLGYAEGDARNRTVVPSSTSGGAQGVVGTGLSPSGSTGVAGNLGVSVDTEVSVRDYFGGYRYIFAIGHGDPLDRGAVSLRGTAGLTVHYRERDHLGVVSIARTTPPPISVVQTLDQQVNELKVAAVVGGEAVIPVGTRARFVLGGEVGAYLYDFDGESNEHRVQNIGPSSDFDYDLGRPLSVSGLGFQAELHVGFYYHILSTASEAENYVNRQGLFETDSEARLDLFFESSIIYRPQVAQVLNPFNGDAVLGGTTTLLTRDAAVDMRAVVGVRYYLD
jgi:hypothetical protein